MLEAQQTPEARDAAVSLMAVVIVRLFQDRECVTSRDLIEAGFSAAEIVDLFDDACAEASLSIDAREQLALSSDPIAVRRTAIWERAPNVEAPQAGTAAPAVGTFAGTPHVSGIPVTDVMRAFVDYDRLLRDLHQSINPSFRLLRERIETATERHALLAVRVADALASIDASEAV